MATPVCAVCGRPLTPRAGRPGRDSVYCSATCRQRAYRARQSPTAGDGVPALIADLERRVRELSTRPPADFYADVSDLSASVGRLRRIARLAVDAERESAPGVVTPEPVTDSAEETVTDSVTADSVANSITADSVTAAEVTESVTDSVTDSVTPAEGVPDSVDVDESTFAALVEPHRRELHVHCYRMLGSYDDADDLVQETLLRAWRGREGFEGRSSLRAWLYRIATNSCLDFLRRNTRVPTRYEPIPGMDHGSAEPPARITWLQPYPDHLLADLADSSGTGQTTHAAPEDAAVSHETLELVFLAAIQHLPPPQRAVLVARDVLGWSAADTASMLDMTVASVNSALQRARPTLREHLPERRADWSRPARVDDADLEILRRYMASAATDDVDAVADLLSEDLTLTMPPNPFWFVGRDAVLRFLATSLAPDSPAYFGRWRHLPVLANGQPAAAGYVQRPGTRIYRAQTLDVLRIENGRIAEITTFEPHHLTAFGLPLTLSD